MKAYIVHDSPLGTDYWNEGEYSLITEKEVIVVEKWCSNRAFANHDLTVWNEDKLKDHGVTEVYSNGVVVWKDGKITDGCTTGKVYKVYKEWCRDNNNGFAKTYKEFRIRLADHLGTTFEDMIVKRSSGTFYKDFTLTQECKKEYASAYGYDDIDFLA